MDKPPRDLRLSCALVCEIQHQGVTILGLVVNTSADGLSARAPGLLPAGAQVTVTLTEIGLRFDAEIRWRRGDRMGLRLLRTGDLGARLVPAGSRRPSLPVIEGQTT